MADPISAAGGFILQLLKEIQNTGNNWYLASQEWQEFPGQVQQLQRKVEFWETGCTNRGLSQNTALKQSLQDVKSLLEKEVQNLNKRAESCWAGCWPRLCMTLFPARLGRSIQSAINDFDNIPEMLRSNEEATTTLDRLVKTQPFSDPITPDSRYVAFEDSEKEVYEMLNNFDSPPVVLLHGGPGKGKTTLARNMVVHYNKSDQPVFDHVFFLDCGPQARAEDTQFELIQRLGFEPSASLEDDGKTRSIRIRKQIKALLSAQKVLIILDDVSNGEFLQCIIELCGERVKFLVTSQEATLCRVLDHSKVHKIQIQDLEMEVAKTILASHIGLPDRQIPTHVQEVAEAMIRNTDLNPLALASLANGIGYDRSDELVEWEEASSNLLKALDSEVPAVFHGMYPRSFWSTMKLSMDKVSEDSRKLLLLIHAFEGPLIPEEVVKVLYKGLTSQGAPGAFSSIARDELVSRHLVKITTVEAGVSSSKTDLNKQALRKWSMHSLHKLYIEKEMAQDRDSIITSLIDSDTSEERGQMDAACQIVSQSKEVKNSTVLTTLCALYLDKPLASMAETKLRIPREHFSKMRRNAIEPITLLLGHPLSARWTETHHRCVEKVFMSYICNGTLDDSNISQLLGVEIAAHAMCTVLNEIGFIEETCLLNENTRGLMEVLVSWLGLETSKQQDAVSALRGLAYNTSQGLFMTSFPGVLEGILQVLQDDGNRAPSSTFISNIPNLVSDDIFMGVHNQVNHATRDVNPTLQVKVATVLQNLACGGQETMDKIVNYPGVLSELLHSLSKDVNPTLQVQVAKVLVNLTSGGLETKDKIVNYPGVLSQLLYSLSKDVNPTLQVEVATILSQLACSCERHETKDRIVNYPGILSELLHSLSEDVNPTLQVEVARVLQNLACGGHETKEKIVNYPRVVSKLLHSLSKDVNPTLQVQVAMVLLNLTSGGHETKDKIVNYPGVLSELLHSLSKDVNPTLQVKVARVLRNLACACGGHETKDKIVNYPGVLSELLHSLSKDVNPTLQVEVAMILSRLACSCGRHETTDKIVNYPGVLSELLHSLSEDVNSNLQVEVARVLQNLAYGGLEIMHKIVNYPGVLSELLHSLSKDVNPTLQVQVAMVLRNLACGGQETKDKIVNYPGALSELLHSLSKDVNPTLQVQVATVLKNLAIGGHETKDKIVNYPAVLSGLLHLLSKDVNPTLQVEATLAFMSLATRIEDIVQVGNQPGLISSLVKSLSKETNLGNQESVAWALSKLALAEGNIMRMKATEGIIEGLVGILSRTTKWHATFVLTLLDPRRVNEEYMQSASYREGRIRASFRLGLFKEALDDFNKGCELGFHEGLWDDLSYSCVFKAKVGDYQAAMGDANEAVNNTLKNKDRHGFCLQERGTLKMMMGDLNGALVDLNEGLTIDIDDYEILKQRGNVKFRLEDEEGARADAELALRVKPSYVDDAYYEWDLCLGTSSMEYLDYKLK